MRGDDLQSGRSVRQLDMRASDELIQWRVRRLTAAGFELTIAQDLAADCGVDLHAVLELRDRGCPPELAARIVAPLEPSPC